LGRDDKGKQQYRNLTYAMPQLLLLTHGYCLLDRSDTNYPLYQVFLDAEDLAKKNRAGCWEKQRE
jgi:endonuclease YncB( thermonuclease family)